MKKTKNKSGEKALTEKEYAKLLLKIGILEHKLLIMLAVETGMRRADITNVEISNINFEEKYIQFYQKKKKNIHKVYIGDNIINLIRMHLNTLPKNQTKLFRFKDRYAWTILNKYCDLAEIPRRPFHALRPTCVKFAQRRGWSPEQIAKHLDDTIKTIQEHYLTPSDMEMKETTKEKPIN